MATVLSHGEMFAVFPSAGGQYHWTAMVSSPRWRASVSWMTGMSDVIGLWLAIATAAYLCGASGSNLHLVEKEADGVAVTIISMILVNNPDFVVTPAKQYAIFAAMTIVTPCSALGVGHRVNRGIEQALMILSVAGVIVIAVTVLATADNKASAVWGPTSLLGVFELTGRNSSLVELTMEQDTIQLSSPGLSVSCNLPMRLSVSTLSTTSRRRCQTPRETDRPQPTGRSCSVVSHHGSLSSRCSLLYRMFNGSWAHLTGRPSRLS